MNYTEKIKKAKMKLIISLVIALSFLVIGVLAIYIVGHSNKEQRIAEIEIDHRR